MAAKRQRTEVETKAKEPSLSTWSQLPAVLRREIGRMVPGSIGGAGRYEAKIARDYKSSLCGPDRTPQLRTRRLNPSVRGGTVSPFICSHHPLIAPMYFNGPSNPPCCLPLKLESPADWEQVFKLADLGELLIKLNQPTLGVRYYHSGNPEWKRPLLEMYYSDPTLFDSIIFEGYTERKYEGRTVQAVKPLVVYQRNLDNNVMTATYPFTIDSNAVPIDIGWYIASDDEDKEVESQMLARLQSDEWKSADPRYDVTTLIKLAKMAGVYGRFDLMDQLLDETIRLNDTRTGEDDGEEI